MRDARYPDIEDEELVLRALIGDLEAFDELVRRFRGAVIVVAEQVLGSKDAARDVAQEAFLLAFKALPQLDEPAKFAGWLCAIARHRARRVAARDRRAEPTEPSEIDRLLMAQSSELAWDPEEALGRKLAGNAVRAALAELAPELQVALQLYYYEEWPVARIAEFLSLPVTTVKWRLHQGRILMRRRLEEERKNDERRERQPGGDPSHPADAAGDGANRQRGQPYRKPARGRAQRCPPVQRGAEPSRAVRHTPRRLLPAAERGGEPPGSSPATWRKTSRSPSEGGSTTAPSAAATTCISTSAH